MDHFILPPGAEHYITVPYKCVEPYDNEGFHTYPERNGWTADDIEGKNEFGQRSPEDVEAFFQSWLFFGVLVEVFKIVDVEIDQDHFIDYGEGVVTTRMHPDLMEVFAIAWKETWPDGDLPFELASAPNAVATTEILKTVFRVMRPFCPDVTAEGRTSVPSTLICPEIVVSIIGLATTFFEAGKFLYKEFGQHISLGGGTPLLRSILEKKWCPFHVTTMQMELRLDAQYYLAALPGLPKNEFKRHVDCTNMRCIEKPVDEATYVLRHAVAGCSCQPVPIPIKDLLHTIEQGDTPVVSFHRDNGGNPYLKIKGFNMNTTSNFPYISISHVWSDGMGNPHRNALPACLLESIQKMVNAVDFPDRESGQNHVGFWMDTLCIPVEPQYDVQRKATIIKMRQIYQEASATLAVESQLQTILSTVSLIQRCVYFYATKWSRRLWTYQEGGLPKRLCFQFRDRSLELNDIYEGINRFHEPEHRGESMVSQMQKRLADQFSDYLYNQFYFVKSGMDVFAAEGTIDSDRWMAFIPIMASYSPRMTTRQSDEPLCLASVLRLDTTPLVHVKGPDGLKSDNKEIRKRADRGLADERMIVLYCLIGTIQSFIIFNRYPRLPTEGFRWAPRTFLGQLPWPLPGDIESSRQEFEDGEATITKDGLTVEYPSIEFDYHPDLEATAGEKFFVDIRVGKSSGDPAISGDDGEDTSDDSATPGDDEEDKSDNSATSDDDDQDKSDDSPSGDNDEDKSDDSASDDDEEDKSDNSATPGDDDEDIVGRGRYLVEPVNLHNDPPDFAWAIDASYRLVLQISPEDMVMGKSTIAVLGRLLPWERTSPCIRHERLVRVTLVPLEHDSDSDDLSTPKVEGIAVSESEYSMVVV